MSTPLAWLPASEPATSGKQQKYSFLAGHYTISFATRQLTPYAGKPLTFYAGGETLRSVRYQFQRFVGSANLVEITAVDRLGRPCNLRLRERTSVEKQRADVPSRPPFEETIRLVEGRGVDIQVFGFDLTGLTQRQAAQAREQFVGAVQIVNQELFVDDDEIPFAVLTWRRSDRDIVIIGAQGLLVEQDAILPGNEAALTFRNR